MPRKVLDQAVHRNQRIIDNRTATIDLRTDHSKEKLDTNCLEKAKHKLEQEKRKHKKSLKYNKQVRAANVSRAEYDKLEGKLLTIMSGYQKSDQ